MNKTTFNALLGLAIAVFIGAWFYSGTFKSGYSSQDDASPEAIHQRIRPFGDAVVTGSEPSPAVTQQPATPVVAAADPVVAAPAAAAPSASLGKDTYATACFACHTTGVAGSPKLGDVDVWAPRIAQGMATLNDNAINGYQGSAGIMPAKGGRVDLSDEAVIAAVAYMVEESR